ncbi:MAG: HAD family phosphatase [Candidatus Peribacteraceae bacterium]|nr:HAD family phosphatase [Candidatus Peribacteraceae bacterium]
MLQAIFFDNDGILVDTEPMFFEATRRTIKPLGIDLTQEWFIEENLKKNTNAFSLLKAKGATDEEIERHRADRNLLYESMLREHVPVFDGVAEVLELLSEKFLLGVVSNSRRTTFDIIMEKSGLRKFFAFELTVDDIGYGFGKPNPRPYLLALEKSGKDPSVCIAIEDNERGVTAAHRAGIQCIAIPHALTKDHDFSLAVKVLKSMRELPTVMGC